MFVADGVVLVLSLLCVVVCRCVLFGAVRLLLLCCLCVCCLCLLMLLLLLVIVASAVGCVRVGVVGCVCC